jgi:taurine dehydrogenase small subunit
VAEDAKLNVLERMLDGFNRHDLDAIVALFTEDCVLESPRGPDPWARRFVGKIVEP